MFVSRTSRLDDPQKSLSAGQQARVVGPIEEIGQLSLAPCTTRLSANKELQQAEGLATTTWLACSSAAPEAMHAHDQPGMTCCISDTSQAVILDLERPQNGNATTPWNAFNNDSYIIDQ